MQRNIIRSYLHISSKNDLIKSSCKEKNLEVYLEKKPTPELCKFFYKEVGKDFFWKDWGILMLGIARVQKKIKN